MFSNPIADTGGVSLAVDPAVAGAFAPASAPAPSGTRMRSADTNFIWGIGLPPPHERSYSSMRVSRHACGFLALRLNHEPYEKNAPAFPPGSSIRDPSPFDKLRVTLGVVRHSFGEGRRLHCHP